MKKFFALLTVIACNFTFYGQNINGTITDSNNNEELIGVNIILSNGTGTATDVFGKYNLKTVVGIQKVTFRYIGYEDIIKERSKIATTQNFENRTEIDKWIQKKGVEIEAKQKGGRVAEKTLLGFPSE